VATIEVVAIDDRTSRLQWSGTFEPLGPEADVCAFVAGIYEAGLDSVRAQLS